VEVGGDEQDIVRIEAEVGVEGAGESTDGDERGGDEDGADGDLENEEDVAE
jgi:hypothetical protein